MKDVYIVHIGYGDWEDSSVKVDSVWTDEAAANERKQAIITQVEADKNMISPIECIDRYSQLPESTTPEQYKMFFEWIDKVDEANEFRWCEVQKVELNKPITN